MADENATSKIRSDGPSVLVAATTEERQTSTEREEQGRTRSLNESRLQLWASEDGTPRTFTFGQAITPSLDFTGTRKGPAGRSDSLQAVDAGSNIGTPAHVPGRPSTFPVHDRDESEPPGKDSQDETRSSGRLAMESSLFLSKEQGAPPNSTMQSYATGDSLGDSQNNEGTTAADSNLPQASTAKGTLSASGTSSYEWNRDQKVSHGGGDSARQSHIDNNAQPSESDTNLRTEMYDHGYTKSVSQVDRSAAPNLSVEEATADSDAYRVLSLQTGQPYPSTINDMLHEIASTWHKQEQNLARELNEEREVWKAELAQWWNKNADLQAQMDIITQRNHHLETTIANQKIKLEGYSAKVVNYRKFVEGLGNDLQALKQNARSHQNLQNEIIRDVASQRTAQTALHHELDGCAARSTQLKEKISKTCQEVNTELNKFQDRTKHLEQELVAKSELLTEEMGLRARLLEEFTSFRTMYEAESHQLRSRQDTLLQILDGDSASTARIENKESMRDLLKQIITTIQNDDLHGKASGDQIAKLEHVMRDQFRNVMNFLEDHRGNDAETQSSRSALSSHLDMSFASLRTAIAQQIQQLRGEQSQQQTVIDLRSKLSEFETRISYDQDRLSVLQASELELKEQNLILQTKAETLKEQIVPPGFESVELSGMKKELQLKSSALENVKSELTEKVQELQLLLARNADLQIQIDEQQVRLDDTLASATEANTRLQDLQTKHRADIERIQVEMSENARQFHVEQKCRAENELKKAIHERETALSQLEQMKNDLETTRATYKDLQEGSSTKSSVEHKHLQQQVQLQDEELKRLQTTINKLQSQLHSGDTARENVVAFESQNIRQQVRLNKLEEEKNALLRQLEEIQAYVIDVQNDKARALSDLEKSGKESKIKIDELELKLKIANEQVAQLNKAIENANTSSDIAVVEQKEKADKQIEALQLRLAQAQAELEQKQEEDRAFRYQVERSWQMEQKKYDNVIAEYKKRTETSQRCADEAQAEVLQLRKGVREAVETEQSTDVHSQGSNQDNIEDEMELQSGRNNRPKPRDKLSPGSTTTYLDEAGHHTSSPFRTKGDGKSTSQTGPNFEAAPSILVKDSQKSSNHSRCSDRSIGALVNEIAAYADNSEYNLQPELNTSDQEKDDISLQSITSAVDQAILRSSSTDRTNSGHQSLKAVARPNSGSRRVPPTKMKDVVAPKHNGVKYAAHHFQQLYQTPDPPESPGKWRGSVSQPNIPGRPLNDKKNDFSTVLGTANRSMLQYGEHQTLFRTSDAEPLRTPKRHAGSLGLSSLQAEKKRQVGAAAISSTRVSNDQTSRLDLPSTNDKHRTSSLQLTRSRVQNSNPEFRKQTLYSRASRQQKGSRSVSKDDRMKARFSQEFDE